MLTLEEDKLVFTFPDLHEDAKCEIDFKRTLRLPDDNKVYPLPPNLGRFPLVHTEDYANSTPKAWQKFGGVMLPMYQSEALWINFSSPTGYPFAVKIATGKINAVTGKSWKNEIEDTPQDYLAIPKQPWLDGFHTSDNMVRQFVAMPLGQGYSAEEELTGKAEFGGIQIIVYPIKVDVYEEILRQRAQVVDILFSRAPSFTKNMSMGLAAGGRIKQEIYKDAFNLSDYDTTVSSRCFIQLVNSENWQKVTGSIPPTKPFSAKEYENHGLPWFDYYSDAEVLAATGILTGLKGVASRWLDKQGKPLEGNKSITPKRVVKIGKDQITDGDW